MTAFHMDAPVGRANDYGGASMTRQTILASFLLTFAACGGDSKSASEPQPAPAEEMVAEEPAPVEPAPEPVEPPAPVEPPPPEPKTLSEDLDGDGTPETISLAPGELTIGEAKVAVAAVSAEALPNVELRVIDLSKKDKVRELVIVNPGAESATWWIISYDPVAKTAGEPIEVMVTSDPVIKGDNKLVVESEDCGQKITTTWQVKKGVLTKGKEKKKGKRDEAKCAGATPAAEPAAGG